MLRLFCQHGCTILQRRLTGPHTFSSKIVTWANDLARILAGMEESGAKSVRDTYTVEICTSIMANLHRDGAHRALILDLHGVEFGHQKHPQTLPDDLLPFATAAVGNAEIFAATIDPAFDIHSSVYPFYSVLSAAVATGKTQFLDTIFRDMNARGITPVSDHDQYAELRRAQADGFMIVRALEVATVTSQTEAAERIHEFVLDKQAPALKKWVKDRNLNLIKKCMEHREPGVAQSAINFGLYKRDRSDVFAYGDLTVRRYLIGQGCLDPNAIMATPEHWRFATPLTIALESGRLEVFGVLLESGADIDGTPDPDLRVSLSWHAANLGDETRVKFLLKHGASPEAHGGWRSPLRVAHDRGRENIIELLRGG